MSPAGVLRGASNSRTGRRGTWTPVRGPYRGHMDSEHQDLQSRRDRLRAERQASHSAPGRVRLKLSAVVMLVAGLLTWLMVSWLSSGAGNSQELPVTDVAANAETRDTETRDAETPEGSTGREELSGAQGIPGEAVGAETSEAAGAEQSAPEVPIEVIVHVAGAVKEPQVVTLPPGSRVIDAVEAAGGITAEAAPDLVNLAAAVEDGTLIWIPTEEDRDNGLVPPGGSSAETPSADGSSAEGSGAGGSGLVNVNTATSEELQQLTGVGPALAERIMTYREAHGPFGALEELAGVSGIGPAVLENIADHVTW